MYIGCSPIKCRFQTPLCFWDGHMVGRKDRGKINYFHWLKKGPTKQKKFSTIHGYCKLFYPNMIIKNVNDNRRQEFVDIKDERRRSHYLDENQKAKERKNKCLASNCAIFHTQIKFGQNF